MNLANPPQQDTILVSRDWCHRLILSLFTILVFNEQHPMRLLNPTDYTLEQGSIFNCLRVPQYDGCHCSGIILTARCDLEHCKQSVISFLPVVPIDDWLERDFCRILAGRLQKATQNALYEQLRKAGVDDVVLNTIPLVQIIEKELIGTAKTTATTSLNELTLIGSAMEASGKHFADAGVLWKSKPREAEKILEDLVNQRLPEFYYLNDVDISSNKDSGYVVLLRGMCSAPTEQFYPIRNGIEAEELRTSNVLNPWLDPDADAICMVTGLLRSPDIEHLAQSFANLFVRIGLEDQLAKTPKRISAKFNTTTQ